MLAFISFSYLTATAAAAAAAATAAAATTAAAPFLSHCTWLRLQHTITWHNEAHSPRTLLCKNAIFQCEPTESLRQNLIFLRTQIFTLDYGTHNTCWNICHIQHWTLHMCCNSFDSEQLVGLGWTTGTGQYMIHTGFFGHLPYPLSPPPRIYGHSWLYFEIVGWT